MTDTHAINIVWEYMCIVHPFKKADAMFVLGTYDLNVPKDAAELFLKNVAPVIIFSGSGTIHANKTAWSAFEGRPEAEVFADIAEQAGVAPHQMLIENRSQNTGENILFSQKLLRERGITIQTGILFTKPYMSRRAYATALKLWPEIAWSCASKRQTFLEYLNVSSINADTLTNILVGDMQRIIEYPKRGFQIVQDIPADVYQAYTYLIAAGYTKNLIEV